MDTTLSTHLRSAPWVLPWVVAWLLGALVRTRAQNVEQRRLRQVERESRAVAEERNRIARELHDVIGHSVSVMTVQASAVRRRLTPDQAVERAGAGDRGVRRPGGADRDASDGRRAAAGRRGHRAGATTGPVGRSAGWSRSSARPGSRSSLQVEGEPHALPPGLDLTAYRLVQEGLTNALKHAATAACAEVRISWAPATPSSSRSATTAQTVDPCRDRQRAAGHAGARRGVRRTAGRRALVRTVASRWWRRSRWRPMTIRVLIADDQALVRAGFRMILEIEPDL